LFARLVASGGDGFENDLDGFFVGFATGAKPPSSPTAVE